MLVTYFKERDGAEVIETDHGFLAYVIRADQLFITDFFIKPEARKSGAHFRALMREAFKRATDAGCGFFTCRVPSGTKNFDARVKAYLKFGFSITEARDTHIGLALELKECAWAAAAE